LLKLKRVELHGFKSFYDRTEMKFHGSGITAVVGPNGCGKSNLSDAISWVLGEQSAKSLRGSRMEDVIFAGSRDRKPLGMASVTLTLVPGEEEAQAAAEPPKSGAAKAAEQTGEITITRRLYRSGESEYLINGKLARLRDIQDLFFGTGLGPESYAIIEQGRIGQILSNKPQDRRALIEEAAGITKFKTKKRLAEAKLESAKQNLSRVFDILEEVTRQVNSLKRQAAKTRRYAELKAEGTGHLRQILAAKSRMLEREAARIAIELSLGSAELEQAQKEIAACEQEQSRVQEASYATERELTEARQQLAGLQLEAERVRSRLEYQLKQIQQIGSRLAASEQEAERLQAQEAERLQEREELGQALERLQQECAAARGQLDQKGQERQVAQAELSEHEKALEAARQKSMRLMGEASARKNRITQLEAQLAAADRDTERARAAEQQSEADLARVQQMQAQISERLAARQTTLFELSEQRKQIEQALQEKRAALKETRQTVSRLQGECSRLKARRDSLEDVIQHRSYTTETVKQLFTAVKQGKAPGFQPVGVLADFLEVDPQIEKAAEEFLHDELEYVVVREWSDADRGIELMRRDLNGRVTFLVEQGAEADSASENGQAFEGAPGIRKLSEALRLTNGLSRIPLGALPRLGRCYIVEDRAEAQRLAKEHPDCWFLLSDGVSYHGPAVSGGKKSGAGPLALKRELRELSQLQQAREEELKHALEAAGELERTIAELDERLESIRSEQQAQEKDVLAMDHESRKLAEELQRAGARLSQARQELEKIARDRVQLQADLDRDRCALAECEQARAAEEAELERLRAQLEGLQQRLARATEEHATLRAGVASLEERQRSLTSQQMRLESQIREITNRRAQLIQEGARLTEERAKLIESNRELEVRQSELGESMRAADQRVQELAGRESELRNQLAVLEEQLKGLRANAQALQERRTAQQVALARAESEMKHLEETCRKELETSVAELLQGTETLPGEAELEQIEAQYAEVRRKIEALGPVNPQALEEFEEAQQRQEFLQAQRQDLLDSIRDTEKAIQELDAESRKRFSEAFQAINVHFREMFKILFGGGTAEMRLTDETNAAESGIDIIASPPGKRLQSVLLLSGGEKSLTAMALLMAIFQYSPSPFCILDEVDAPLDEPNIDRLMKLLREMSEKTQFIVITHSKRTMEAAQALYGVTMQEPGVSKLVSVKFKEAETPRQRKLALEAPQQQEEMEMAMA